MTEENLKNALHATRRAVVEASKELKKYYGNIAVLSKGDGSSISGVVTEIDRKTEQFLAAELGKFSSEIGFRGEEYGVQSHRDTTWLVDPIDGTAHFIRGLPFCTTMVALVEDGEVVLSVIHDFVRGDTYYAVRGVGAFCNDKKLTVSTRSLKEGLVSFETKLEKPENYKKYIAMREKTGLISTINCGFEFAMIASGKLDGRVGLDPYGMDWDYAAGSLLVSEAGGITENIGKTTYEYQNHDFIIANKAIHSELVNGVDAIFPYLTAVV